MTKSMIEKLYTNVSLVGDCLLWNGGKNKKGYGVVWDENQKVVGVHRAAFKAMNGEIPAGAYVCHSCDNPSCIRPDHLWLGTAKENTLDMVSKGRWKSPPHYLGEISPRAKLANSDVMEIRRLLKSGVLDTELARKYTVSKAQISKIKMNRAWQSV